jgi:hypothetical protein
MSYDQKQLQMGTSIEHEHTQDDALAQKIAMDHLREDPKYYDKLKAAGLEECGADVAVIKIGGAGVVGQAPKSGEANPAKPLVSSNLGSGVPKPLTSTTLQPPKGKNSIPTLGKTPPKTGGKDMALGDSNGAGVPVEDEEGNQRPNSIRVNGTVGVSGKDKSGSNSNCDATDFFGGMIRNSLNRINEGGATLKKK